jgi:PilZ domain
MTDHSGPGGSNWVTNRKKRRIPCQLWVGEREHSALILDLSPSGVFVQTHAKTQRGERLRLQFSHEDALLELKVEVVRTKSVPQSLLAATKGGIGVRIVSAPEEYYELLAGLGINEAKPAFELEREPGLRFRVYVAQTGGPRSRRVEVAAPDAAAAGVRALEELGSGWKVLRTEQV